MTKKSNISFIPCAIYDCDRTASGFTFNSEGPKGSGYYLSDNIEEPSIIELECSKKFKLLTYECSIFDGSIEKIKNLISGPNSVKPEKCHIISASINDRYDIIKLLLPYLKNKYEINTDSNTIQKIHNSHTKMYARPTPEILSKKYQKFIKEYEEEENKYDKDYIKLKEELK